MINTDLDCRDATVREKVSKMKKILGQIKVREFHFQSGKFRKMKKGNLKKFRKKVDALQASENFIFHKFYAVYTYNSETILFEYLWFEIFLLTIKSASMNVCTNIWNCQRIRMAFIGLHKGS